MSSDLEYLQTLLPGTVALFTQNKFACRSVVDFLNFIFQFVQAERLVQAQSTSGSAITNTTEIDDEIPQQRYDDLVAACSQYNYIHFLNLFDAQRLKIIETFNASLFQNNHKQATSDFIDQSLVRIIDCDIASGTFIRLEDIFNQLSDPNLINLPQLCGKIHKIRQFYHISQFTENMAPTKDKASTNEPNIQGFGITSPQIQAFRPNLYATTMNQLSRSKLSFNNLRIQANQYNTAVLVNDLRTINSSLQPENKDTTTATSKSTKPVVFPSHQSHSTSSCSFFVLFQHQLLSPLSLHFLASAVLGHSLNTNDKFQIEPSQNTIRSQIAILTDLLFRYFSMIISHPLSPYYSFSSTAIQPIDFPKKPRHWNKVRLFYPRWAEIGAANIDFKPTIEYESLLQEFLTQFSPANPTKKLNIYSLLNINQNIPHQDSLYQYFNQKAVQNNNLFTILQPETNTPYVDPTLSYPLKSLIFSLFLDNLKKLNSLKCAKNDQDDVETAFFIADTPFNPASSSIPAQMSSHHPIHLSSYQL